MIPDGDISVRADDAATESATHAGVPGDFDFLYGCWRVRNERLRRRLAGCAEQECFDSDVECRPVLGGFGNIEQHVAEARDGTRWIGFALRLFDPGSRRWSIHWTDNRRLVLDPPVSGAFSDGVGSFLGRDQHDGLPVLVRFVWDRRDPDHPRWEQAFSADAGASWETNWIMRFARSARDDGKHAP